MGRLWNSFKIAFSMYSKIPMPKSDWTKENMRYIMCFFSSGRGSHRRSYLAVGVFWRSAYRKPDFLCFRTGVDTGADNRRYSFRRAVGYF